MEAFMSLVNVWRVNAGSRSFGIGEDSGQPVPFDYQPPNRFTGEIEKVVIDLELRNLKATSAIGTKRTSRLSAMTSAFDPKRTFPTQEIGSPLGSCGKILDRFKQPPWCRRNSFGSHGENFR